ncbi:hypothetical protein FB567DRAFT_315201 [Paraphoma chrysanthemicola]|uniref:Uncharacterized protein n=1 Tax=Paraphoma chrysanthemicola TaxID=798071 RepID=A0A8K0RAX5_9PLEO|nr:hypothetical protein FB567DRAFT_315201 [Paraphoma chrysanthemicola]
MYPYDTLMLDEDDDDDYDPDSPELDVEQALSDVEAAIERAEQRAAENARNSSERTVRLRLRLSAGAKTSIKENGRIAMDEGKARTSARSEGIGSVGDQGSAHGKASARSQSHRPKKFKSWRETHQEELREEWEDELAWHEIAQERREQEMYWKGRRRRAGSSREYSGEGKEAPKSAKDERKFQPIINGDLHARATSTKKTRELHEKPAPQVRWRYPERTRGHLKIGLHRIYTEYILSQEFIDDINGMLNYIRKWSLEDAIPIMRSFIHDPENEGRQVAFRIGAVAGESCWTVELTNPDASVHHPRVLRDSGHLPLAYRPKRLDWGIHEYGGLPSRCVKEGCGPACPHERSPYEKYQSLVKGRSIQRSESKPRPLGAIGGPSCENIDALPNKPDEDRRKMPPPPRPPPNSALQGVPKDAEEIKARIHGILSQSTEALARKLADAPASGATRVSEVLGTVTNSNNTNTHKSSTAPPPSPRPKPLALNIEQVQELQPIQPPTFPRPGILPSPPSSPLSAARKFWFPTPDLEPTPPSYYIKVPSSKLLASHVYGDRLPPEQARAKHKLTNRELSEKSKTTSQTSRPATLVKVSSSAQPTTKPKKAIRKQHHQLEAWQTNPDRH